MPYMLTAPTWEHIWASAVKSSINSVFNAHFTGGSMMVKLEHASVNIPPISDHNGKPLQMRTA